MIEQLHSKNTTSKQFPGKKPATKTNLQHMLKEVSKDLLQPREQAVAAILAKAAAMKLV